MLHDVILTARKDFRGFFTSPTAYLFLGAFLAICLFNVFWMDGFFARNIADLRPLFDAMPVLMIFLAGALTMRAWAEERRSGTLETLLTTPVRPLSLVIGKFLAVEGLVALALLLTVPLALTVSAMGQLDWGPVIGGYVATLFLAATYLAIGLCVSAQSDNPIMALIGTVLACAVLYFIGSDMMRALVGRDTADVLALIGSGSRFQSIARGVFDLHDIAYYLTLTAAFLSLNSFQLARLRWQGSPRSRLHTAVMAVAALVVVNLLAVNFWLAPLGGMRADLTAGGRYTLSDATRTVLKGLHEPLLIRGYFSSHTHPLLAPLVPQMEDLLKEYAQAGGSGVRVEIANPSTDREAEKSAAEYGIRPTPFQTANHQSTSVVNAYFNLVVSYGDETQVLGFRDLIDVKGQDGERLQVGLANPEYAITSAIKKVTQAYRSGGNPFASVKGGMTFHAYLSPQDSLPKGLLPVRAALIKTLDTLKAAHPDSFRYSIEDPAANGGELAATLKEKQGLGPQIASLMDPKPFWFSLQMEGDGRTLSVPLPKAGTLDSAAFDRAITATAKRLAPGYMRTIAVSHPAVQRPYAPGMPPIGPRYTALTKTLQKSARIIDANLKSGHVPADADVLLVLDPQSLDNKGRFAVDQFLMRGGSVVIATSPFQVSLVDTLTARPSTSGLEDWLKSYGISIGKTMVLDPQNAALPVPQTRQVGGMSLREIHMMPYPHFPDVRTDGLNQTNPVTASLSQLTLNWASPISIDPKAARGLSITPLVKSSPHSWTSAKTSVLPDYSVYPDSGFPPGRKAGRQILAVAAQGSFPSAFAGKTSPLVADGESSEKAADAKAEPQPGQKKAAKDSGPSFDGVIAQSPDSAKLVVVSASNFGSDLMLSLASEGQNSAYTAPVDFLQNAIDWATEDPALMALRGKTQFANTLYPMSSATQSVWEYANYLFAVLGLLLVWGWRRLVQARDRRRYAHILSEVAE